ncbi:MAG: T7SS effector LXG polymorphic toxin [Bacillus sp. (in: firmicutes)]
MKILDVSSLQTSIEHCLTVLDRVLVQFADLEEAVSSISALDGSLNGHGGDAIKSFYEECHQPFLIYAQTAAENYISMLTAIKKTILQFEPSENGKIREDFLAGDIPIGLTTIRNKVTDLTGQANGIIDSIRGIVAVPNIDDSQTIQKISTADRNAMQTMEKLYELDQACTQKLDAVYADCQTMSGYITTLNSMFVSKKISAGSYMPGTLKKFLEEREAHPATAAASALLDKAKQQEDHQLAGLWSAIQSGLTDSLVPLAIMTGFQKSGLLRIEYTKKKNHYAFKYNRNLLKFLKGRIGPHGTRTFITAFNRTNKQHAAIEKKLRLQGRNVPGLAGYKDSRPLGKKLQGKALKLVTGNKSLSEVFKGLVYKNSGKDLLIAKESFKKVAGRTSAIGSILVSGITAYSSIGNRWGDAENNYKGERLSAEKGKIVGEETNKAIATTVGASSGAYIGAAIGGLVSGPFAPFGAAAGAVVGSAVGAAVGGWASKYTKKLASNIGESVGKTVHSVKDKLAGIGKVFSFG